MNLTKTPESIVPEQSVIDSWPKMYRKKSTHACQKQKPAEFIFHYKLWFKNRHRTYPMVEAKILRNDSLNKYMYQPVCGDVVLKDQDIIVLNEDGSYSVKSKDEQSLKNADEAKFYAKYLEAVSYAP